MTSKIRKPARTTAIALLLVLALAGWGSPSAAAGTEVGIDGCEVTDASPTCEFECMFGEAPVPVGTIYVQVQRAAGIKAYCNGQLSASCGAEAFFGQYGSCKDEGTSHGGGGYCVMIQPANSGATGECRAYLAHLDHPDVEK